MGSNAVLQNAIAKAEDQAKDDQTREPRRFGYQEARLLIPTILDLPRPCAFRVIAAPENMNLRGGLVTLAEIPTSTIPRCVLIEDPTDSAPNTYEKQPQCPNGSVVIRAKPSWSDKLVFQFRVMGFHQVVHGKELLGPDQEDVEVVFGTGSLW